MNAGFEKFKIILLVLIFVCLMAFFIWPEMVFAANTDIVINEIMYNLAGTDTGHEWIEVFNNGFDEIDLTGWRFNDGDDDTNHGLNMPSKNGSRGSMIIFPSGYLLLAGDAQVFIADLPNCSGSIIDTVMSLSNSSATLKIFDKDGAKVASAYYSKDLGGNGNGKTLEWGGSNFRESTIDGGTPGGKNSVYSSDSSSSSNSQNQTETPEETSSNNQTATSTESAFKNYSQQVLISEFMPWPTGLAGEQEPDKEWAELVNLDSETIDLSNWQIDDEPDESSPQKIPSGTLLGPGEFLVIELTKNILNNDGDQIRLLWPDDQTVHSISYQKALLDESCARFENGLWLWTNQPTPGQENKKSLRATSASLPKDDQQSFPLAQTLAEEATENAQEQETKQATQNEISSSQIQASDLIAAQSAHLTPSISSTLSAAASQQPTNNDKSSIFLILAGVFVLSFVSALGLVYFKRKASVDNQQN